jgi:hypothetical protein
MTASLLKLNGMRGQERNKNIRIKFRPKKPQEATIRDKGTEVRTKLKINFSNNWGINVNCNELVQHRGKWRGAVSTVMNPRLP